MSVNELKACPFCGGKAKAQGMHNLMARAMVECTNEDCGAMVICFTSHEAAAKAWNTRATPPANAQLVEALRAIVNDPYTNAFARTIALNALAQGVGNAPEDGNNA